METREKNQCCEYFVKPIFYRDAKRGVPDMTMMTRTCRTLPPCVFTRTHNESFLKGSVVMSSKPDCVQTTVSGKLGEVVYT